MSMTPDMMQSALNRYAVLPAATALRAGEQTATQPQ
jgi:hypothetical protein